MWEIFSLAVILQVSGMNIMGIFEISGLTLLIRYGGVFNRTYTGLPLSYSS